MASPALAVLAALASRRSFFFFRARAFLPLIALEEWMVLCPRRARRCASRLPRLCVFKIFGLAEQKEGRPLHTF